MPWRCYLSAALGALGWTPEAFWAATPHEFRAAWEGRFARTRGISPTAQPLRRSELAELMRRFPDAVAWDAGRRDR